MRSLIVALVVVTVAEASADDGSRRRGESVVVDDVPCDGPFAAHQAGALKRSGSPRIAGVALPAGHVVAEGAFWVSDEPVVEPVALWTGAAAAFPESGLWPVLLGSGTDLRPGSVTQPAAYEVEAIMRRLWDAAIEELMPELDDGFLDPFDADFPGLAPGNPQCGYPALTTAAEQSNIPPYRLLLVPARRPADVIVALGWNGTNGAIDDTGELGAIVASWEDRFGAYLYFLDQNSLTFLMERPPASTEDQLRFFAEGFALLIEPYLQVESLAFWLDIPIAGEYSVFWD